MVWCRILVFILLAQFVDAAGVAAQSRSDKKPDLPRESVRDVGVRTRVIDKFHRDGEARVKIGKLIWRGGLVLSASDREFGGYSGLEVSPDGKRFVAVSDAGTWLNGEFVYSGKRLAGIRKARIGPLKALANRRLIRQRDRDAEAIRLLSGDFENGIALIAFERNQRVGFFPIIKGTVTGPKRYLRPSRRLSFNKGLESVAVMRAPPKTRVGHARGGKSKGNKVRANKADKANKAKSGDIVAFAERSLDANGHHRGWIWTKARGKPRPLALTNVGGFDITDAVALRSGDLIVLERRFRWSEGVKMRIRRINSRSIKAGAVLAGQTLVRADLRYQIDNMEGIAVHIDARGRTVLTVISDNNFNALLQRTLLLQFELKDD